MRMTLNSSVVIDTAENTHIYEMRVDAFLNMKLAHFAFHQKHHVIVADFLFSIETKTIFRAFILFNFTGEK